MARLTDFDCVNGRKYGFRPGTILAVLALFAGPAVADDLWVDRNSIGGPCDDGRSRTEVGQTTPWCTLKTAANRVQPGDVVHVRAGEYTERHDGNPVAWGSAVLQMVVSGTAADPIRFSAHPGESVILSSSGGASWGVLAVLSSGLTPRFIEIEGFTLRGFAWKGVMVKETSDIVLRDLEVTECVEGAIGILMSARVTIEGCRVHHNNLTGWTSPINFWLCEDGNVIRGNHVWANTDEDSRETEGHGIILDFCEDWGDTLIENNVIWNNEGLCMNILHSDHAVIRNNTCWQNNLGRETGTVGELWLGGDHISAHNNILVSRGFGPALFVTGNVSDVSTISSDSNILWSPNTSTVAGWPPWNTGTLDQYRAATSQNWDDLSLNSDPLLVDPQNVVFRPTAQSPAIDSGDDAFASLWDIDGVGRPLDGNGDGITRSDRGAYEIGAIFVDGFESGTSNMWTQTEDPR